MKKTLTVNISGIVFNIDEDAYTVLNDYIVSIKNYFAGSADRDEIINDIENRIAEILSGRLGSSKQVITIEDVESVIGIIGLPDDFGVEAGDTNERNDDSNKKTKRTKRLFRDPDNVMISGVCGGLGAYFHTDPVWFRLAFIVLALAGVGAGILVYIVLWAIMPLAETTADKLEMRGEKVDLSNIEKSIREEIENLKDKFNKFAGEAQNTYKKKSERHGRGMSGAGNAVLGVIEVFAKIILIILGLIMLFLGVASVIVIGVALFGVDGTFLFPGILNFHSLSFGELSLLLLGSPGRGLFLLTGLILFAGIPVLLLIYGGLRLVFGIKPVRYLAPVAMTLWLAGLFITTFYGVLIATDFKETAIIRKQETVKLTPGNTVYLRMNGNTELRKLPMVASGLTIDNTDIYLLRMAPGGLFGTPNVYIKKGNDSLVKMIVNREALGRSGFVAKKRAEKIEYRYEIKDSLIVFDPYFKCGEDNLFRGQNVFITLEVPAGKKVDIGREMVRILGSTWYHSPGSLAGNVFKMSDAGKLEKE